jgi:hypothetical protein
MLQLLSIKKKKIMCEALGDQCCFILQIICCKLQQRLDLYINFFSFFWRVNNDSIRVAILEVCQVHFVIICHVHY